MFYILLPVAASFSSRRVSCGPRAAPPRRGNPLRLSYWDDVDSLVLSGDASVLVGYGLVQGATDAALLPLATSQPELFTQSQPVLAAQSQGLLLAALWVGITSQMHGYSPTLTRTLQRDVLVPLAAAWLGSSLFLLSAFAALGLPLEAEAEFVLGSLVVVIGWRWLYARWLPMP